jgi:hypothetical protein
MIFSWHFLKLSLTLVCIIRFLNARQLIKIESTVRNSFTKIKNWLPAFLENNPSSSEINKELKKKIKQSEKEMKLMITEINHNIQSKFYEFERQYEYDVNHVKINFEDLPIDDIQKGSWGKILNYAGKIIGISSLILGPIGAIIGGCAGALLSWWGHHQEQEDKKQFEADKERQKSKLLKTLKDKETEKINTYKSVVIKTIEEFQETINSDLVEFQNNFIKIKEKVGLQ